jgi:hypothetical protein
MKNNEVDLNEAKRLIDIRTGKQKAISRYQTKLKEAQKSIRIDELIDDVGKLKETLSNIKMAVESPVPGLENKSYLFTYKGNFYLITGESYKVITDGEAKMEMDANQPELYYICTDQGMCPMPPSYVGKSNATAVQLADDKAVIAYIQKITNVTVKLK